MIKSLAIKNFSIVVSIHLQIKTLFHILKVEIWNIRLKKKNDHKVYTKNDKSIEVIEALNKDLLNHNVKIIYNKKVIDIITEEIAIKMILIRTSQSI